jgi:hypothetical protein
MKGLAKIHGAGWFNKPRVGGRSFLKKSIPETWWWRNFQDRVVAFTIESTYGHAGDSDRWTTPGDMRRIGASLAREIGRFHGLRSTPAARVAQTH